MCKNSSSVCDVIEFACEAEARACACDFKRVLGLICMVGVAPALTLSRGD